MRVLCDDVKNKPEEFKRIHEATGLIGASTIPTIAGLNPYCTPLEEWAYRTQKLPRPDISKKPAVRLGLLAEPVIGEMFEEATGLHPEPYNKIIQHDTIDLAIASPDFIVYEPDGPFLVEAKKYNYRANDRFAEGQMPDWVALQLHWQLGVEGVSKRGYCGAWVGDSDFYHPHLEPSADVFGQLVDMAGKFLEMVASDTPPGAVAGDTDTIKALLTFKEQEIYLQDQAAELLLEYDKLQDEKKAIAPLLGKLEADLKKTQNQIILLMGGATKGRYGNRVVLCSKTHVKETKPREYDRINFRVVEAQ